MTDQRNRFVFSGILAFHRNHEVVSRLFNIVSPDYATTDLRLARRSVREVTLTWTSWPSPSTC